MAFVSLLQPFYLAAQTDPGVGTLAGVVLASDSSAVAGASVTAKNSSSGFARTVNADAAGHFSIPNLTVGTYIVDVTGTGFAPGHRTGVQLTAAGVENFSITLTVANMSQAVTVEASVSIATQAAPSQSSLEARSAQSLISTGFIDNFTSPLADYTEVTQMAPGTFSVNPNGVGLGDSKTFFRGFSDGQYTMTFDGIPFNDTNSPTHHSWAFFPSQWTGSTLFDRSPGSASTVGPTNFGGSINLNSREVQPEPDIRAGITYGSFNTRLVDLGLDSGRFLGDRSALVIDLHELRSDGYQTYNYQKRDAGSMKYQYKLTNKTTLTGFVGILDLWTNTPNTKGPTRLQTQTLGDNYLLSGDPSRGDYFRYNYYHIQTDFEYFGVNTDLGHGWRLDNKMYSYRYWNKQNYAGATVLPNAYLGTDKLNGYRKIGDVLGVTQEHARGTFRTGLWYEWAYTDRYQVPTNPLTRVDTVLPNFHEKFITLSAQPYAEYEFKVTPKLSITGGFKLSWYQQHLNQFADNGKTVGALGGVAFVTHTATYTTWQPSADIRYRLTSSWSVYGQYGTGNVIPPSSVFDVKNAKVVTLPKPTQAKTYQAGTVFKANRFTFDFDAYRIHFENPYSTTPDINGEPVYIATGASVTRGVEAESNIVVGYGVNLYLNATVGSARYIGTDKWVQNAPRSTETVGLTYQHKNYDFGFFDKRVGSLFNDNGGTHEAVLIQPFYISNLFFNYTVKNETHLKNTKFRLSINNLFDKHSIVGVVPALATSVTSPGDVLTLLPARSIVFSVIFGFNPKPRR